MLAFFTLHNLFLILFLAFLEGILSIDNALVLALLAKPLPPYQQRKALTYGLLGSVAFRLGAISIISALMKWTWLKYAGGGYLVLISLNHFIKSKKAKTTTSAGPKSFWRTVLLIELMDIAFAVDSILAAIALTPKFWIIFFGGMIGVLIMRYAASIFLKILKRFPHFESTAYLLILAIGIKLVLEGLHLPGLDFEKSNNPAFWAFWGFMMLGILQGFRPKSRSNSAEENALQ